MLFDAAVVAVLLGFLLRGSLWDLLNTKLRFLPLLLVSLVLSILPRLPAVGIALSHAGSPGAVLLTVLRYGLLLTFVGFNFRNVGLLLAGAGGLCNMLVTLANGGRMPVVSRAIAVSPSAANNVLLQRGEILNYSVLTAQTHLGFLCDRIGLRVIGLQGFETDFLSVGDVLLAAGVFLFILIEMRPRLLGQLGRRLKGRQA